MKYIVKNFSYNTYYSGWDNINKLQIWETKVEKAMLMNYDHAVMVEAECFKMGNNSIEIYKVY